jgi:hypothetical protein
VFNVCGWGVVVGIFMLFVVVYYDVEDRDACVYVIKVEVFFPEAVYVELF